MQTGPGSENSRLEKKHIYTNFRKGAEAWACVGFVMDKGALGQV